jgi:hypothetical protein
MSGLAGMTFHSYVILSERDTGSRQSILFNNSIFMIFSFIQPLSYLAGMTFHRKMRPLQQGCHTGRETALHHLAAFQTQPGIPWKEEVN